MVTSPSKPFVYTAKLTARRQAVIDDYAEEIQALYDAAEESTQAAGTPPSSWTIETSLDFVRSVIRSVLKVEVSDDDDIFQHSCDRFASNLRASFQHLTSLLTVYKRHGFEILSYTL